MCDSTFPISGLWEAAVIKTRTFKVTNIVKVEKTRAAHTPRLFSFITSVVDSRLPAERKLLIEIHPNSVSNSYTGNYNRVWKS